MAGQRSWSGRSHGGGLGTWLVATVARLGPLPLYAFITPPVLVYLLRDHAARQAIDGWWARLRPDLGRWGRLLMTARHFHSFGRILADRFLAAWHPEAIRCRHFGQANLAAAMRSPRGCLILSAHLGHWELAGRWLAGLPTRKLNLVMLRGEDPRVEEQVRRTLGDRPAAIIDLADPVLASALVAEALSRGETCCLLGDRSAGAAATGVAVPFLGTPARFPLGPFAAAALTGCWVVPAFCVREGLCRYRLWAHAPFRVVAPSRAGRWAAATAALHRWVGLLERAARRWPLQWHNFFDVWR